VDEKKKNILLVNKADFLTENQRYHKPSYSLSHPRRAWARYFIDNGISYIFFSALISSQENETQHFDSDSPNDESSPSTNTNSNDESIDSNEKLNAGENLTSNDKLRSTQESSPDPALHSVTRHHVPLITDLSLEDVHSNEPRNDIFSCSDLCDYLNEQIPNGTGKSLWLRISMSV
jgi:hypothetical protein